MGSRTCALVELTLTDEFLSVLGECALAVANRPSRAVVAASRPRDNLRLYCSDLHATVHHCL